MSKSAAAKANPELDSFFEKEATWHDELAELRKLALASELTEERKWGQPCYTINDGNVLIIHGFKEYCALLFFKGALMPDPNGILIQQTKNVQGGRQIRFTTLKEITSQKAVLKQYIQAAIDVEKSGAKVEYKETTEFEVAAEFQVQLDKSPALKKAFAALTPGRQRAYLLHFSSAKQSSTRAARVEKCTPQILAGKGMDDR
ncbi:DUF1801 domain-containing protein [Uliginosibacterium sp. H3]|uniref:DUF1801 domain-containing protein n=1 Tax=Uliginosibacterium silvisoli TaxID=3114758 RepID=A0ABU6K8Z0_9RHOO|nr:DUF1801 domain-containing protein [Uliginosibacterium sp. H3]